MDGPIRRALTRRGVLGAGTASVAGCMDGTDSNGPETASAERTAATEATTATEATATEAMAGGSGRIGHVVYYEPEERGPYTDLQDALSDVPDGGVLQLGPYDYDVAEEGRLYLDRPVHVRGVEWSQVIQTDRAGRRNFGTNVHNTGDDADDEPVVEYDGLKHVRLDHLSVTHHGDSPAVLFADTSRSVMRGCTVVGGAGAPRGVVYDGKCYLCRQEGTATKRFSEVCVDVLGNQAGDYMYEFLHSIAVTGGEEARALKTESDRTVIIGGEYMARGEDGAAIEFRSPTTQSVHGGLVIAPGIERSPNPIVIDGKSAYRGVQIYHTVLHLDDGEGAGVQFRNAANCKLVNPIVPTTSGGELAHWSERSTNCSLVTDPDTLAICSYTNDGARSPHVDVVGNAPRGALDVFPTGVPTTVSYNPETGTPVFHDGESWQRVSAEPLDGEDGT